jgi:hypothetical protein
MCRQLLSMYTPFCTPGCKIGASHTYKSGEGGVFLTDGESRNARKFVPDIGNLIFDCPLTAQL